MIEVFTGDDNLPFIKPRQLTGDAKWQDIQDLINRWARRNPRGAVELEQSIKETRSTLADKRFGLMAGKRKGDVNTTGVRIGVMLHPELMQYIEVFYPKFLQTKDELHEFERRFPKFTIPEKV